MYRHILLIDDDEDEFLIISKILRSIPDVKSHYAHDASSAIEFLETGIPDIILLDINMPIKNGLQCLKCIREEKYFFRNIPVFIYSAMTDNKTIDMANSFGINGCIKKTHCIETLKEMLRQALKCTEKYHNIRYL